MTLPRIVLAVNALAWLAFGAWGLFDPHGMLAPVHITGDATSWVELRAMYGGLELGLAAFLAWCLADRARTGAGLAGATLTLGALGLVRAVSALAFGPAETLMWVFVAFELVGTGLNAAAWAMWRGAVDEP